MTAEQLEELLGKVTPDYWQYSSAEGSRVWMSPEQNRRSTYARIGMIERNLYSEDTIAPLSRRVLAAEKLVEALEGIPLGDGNLAQLVAAYREASK